MKTAKRKQVRKSNSSRAKRLQCTRTETRTLYVGIVRQENEGWQCWQCSAQLSEQPESAIAIGTSATLESIHQCPRDSCFRSPRAGVLKFGTRVTRVPSSNEVRS